MNDLCKTLFFSRVIHVLKLYLTSDDIIWLGSLSRCLVRRKTLYNSRCLRLRFLIGYQGHSI